MKKKQVFYGFLALIVFSAIIFLAFQNVAHTSALSNGVRQFFKGYGPVISRKKLRRCACFVEYFLLGTALALLWAAAGWKPVRVFSLGGALGLLDEFIKIPLPTREFEAIDLVIDCAGMACAVAMVYLIKKVKRNKGT